MARGNINLGLRVALLTMCCTVLTPLGCTPAFVADSGDGVEGAAETGSDVGFSPASDTRPIPPPPVADDVADPPPVRRDEPAPLEVGDSGVALDPAPGVSPGGSGDIQSGTLTAGSFDDNLNYDAFRKFLSDVMQNDPDGNLPAISPGKRFVITVQNDSGDPIGDARVVVSDPDAGEVQAQPLLNLTTGSDGRVLFLTGIDGGGEASAFDVTVHPPDGSDPIAERFAADQAEWKLTLQAVESSLPMQLDLAFVVDATGSMADELEFLKAEIDAIAAAVADEFPHVDQRYALIVYRDDGDVYVTRSFDFVASLEEFQSTLAEQRAAGGGDYPEAMHLALEETAGLSWRESGTARMMFLIADAPPHNQYAQRAFDAIVALRQQGLAIYPLAASGAATETELIMRAAALLTLSEYLFLTDDSGVGNPHAEPSIPCYHVQRLDRTMIRVIRAELAGQRIEPDPEHIIRTIGNPVDGVCTDQTTGDGG